MIRRIDREPVNTLVKMVTELHEPSIDTVTFATSISTTIRARTVRHYTLVIETADVLLDWPIDCSK